MRFLAALLSVALLAPSVAFADCYAGVFAPGADGFSIGTIGDASSEWATAFTPTCSGTVTSGTIRGYDEGSPGTHFVFAVRTDSSGTPATTLASSTAIALPGTSASPNWATSTFSSPPSVTSGTDYWLVAARDDALNNTHYYAGYNALNTPDGMSHGNSAWTDAFSGGQAVVMYVYITEAVASAADPGFGDYSVVWY